MHITFSFRSFLFPLSWQGYSPKEIEIRIREGNQFSLIKVYSSQGTVVQIEPALYREYVVTLNLFISLRAKCSHQLFIIMTFLKQRIIKIIMLRTKHQDVLVKYCN